MMGKQIIFFVFYFSTIINYGIASTWDNIQCPVDSFKKISAVDEANHRLYFTSTSLDQNYQIITSLRYLTGDTCISLSIQINGLVNTMIFYNSSLIIGGSFKNINGQNIVNIAMINDYGISGLEISDTMSNWSINSMIVYKDKLYIGGKFNTSSTLIVWDGSLIDYFSESPNGPIYAMYVCNDELFVGGLFDHVSSLYCDNIAKWNDQYWDTVANGLYGYVFSMINYQNIFYVGGVFTNEDSINPIFSIAKFENNVWCSVDTGVFSGLLSMVVYNDLLYVGGMFDQIGGSIEAYHIAIWNG